MQSFRRNISWFHGDVAYVEGICSCFCFHGSFISLVYIRFTVFQISQQLHGFFTRFICCSQSCAILVEFHCGIFTYFIYGLAYVMVKSERIIWKIIDHISFLVSSCMLFLALGYYKFDRKKYKRGHLMSIRLKLLLSYAAMLFIPLIMMIITAMLLIVVFRGDFQSIRDQLSSGAGLLRIRIWNIRSRK